MIVWFEASDAFASSETKQYISSGFGICHEWTASILVFYSFPFISSSFEVRTISFRSGNIERWTLVSLYLFWSYFFSFVFAEIQVSNPNQLERKSHRWWLRVVLQHEPTTSIFRTKNIIKERASCSMVRFVTLAKDTKVISHFHERVVSTSICSRLFCVMTQVCLIFARSGAPYSIHLMSVRLLFSWLQLICSNAQFSVRSLFPIYALPIWMTQYSRLNVKCRSRHTGKCVRVRLSCKHKKINGALTINMPHLV